MRMFRTIKTIMKEITSNMNMGFNSFWEFLACFMPSSNVAKSIGLILLGIITTVFELIGQYIYSSPEAIIFLVALIVFDMGTAVVRSFKQQEFSSRKFPKFIAITISYISVIAIGHNIAEYTFIQEWLPNFIYTGLVLVILSSILENLDSMDLLPSKISEFIREKFEIGKYIKSKGGEKTNDYKRNNVNGKKEKE